MAGKKVLRAYVAFYNECGESLAMFGDRLVFCLTKGQKQRIVHNVTRDQAAAWLKARRAAGILRRVI